MCSIYVVCVTSHCPSNRASRSNSFVCEVVRASHTLSHTRCTTHPSHYAESITTYLISMLSFGQPQTKEFEMSAWCERHRDLRSHMPAFVFCRNILSTFQILFDFVVLLQSQQTNYYFDYLVWTWTVFGVEFAERTKCAFCKHQYIGTFVRIFGLQKNQAIFVIVFPLFYDFGCQVLVVESILSLYERIYL